MGFIASIFTAIIDVIVDIVMVVVQIVEVVVKLIMVLLGWDGGSTQVIEYYEVRNYPLFQDVDRKNPTSQALLQAILSNRDMSASLIYSLVFRSLKGDIKKYMNYIEQGNYFEGFPELDSYILIVDYDELTDALQTLTGVACTVETAYLRALSVADWVKYWLQENKGYDVGINGLGEGYQTTSTSPATPASDTVQVTPSTNHFDVDITSDAVTSDETIVDQRWQVNLNTVQYNATPDTYTVEIYNAAGITLTLPYTVPSRPTQLHYVSTYYKNSNPSRIYSFIYQVGSGTYTDLDTIEEPINIDNSQLQAIPAVPLRIENANYTTFGATKKQQIEDILLILNLKAEEIIDGVMTDSGLAPGDVDNVYVNYGVRMWDTSQAGMSYLYRMFENLYPAQGTTQGAYNNAPAGDDKPHNNILTRTDDKEDAFQWNYITYTFTPLATIDANSGSTENGIYYSDMSKFDDNNILMYPYYSSSGKGTYNVGYKADTLTEVANFLAGNGTVNPGTTTAEAANWLQVTERMSYNNPSPVLQDPNGSTSSLIYLTPDAVYENNGSGVLRIVEQASEETTSGQSITYYKIKPSGLAAYTVVAPIAAMRVVDGDTGKFKTVKFNLGAKEDLMVPFVYTFVRDLSHTDQAKLFLAGAHVSIYVAHYEVIEHAGMSWLTALVMIIIIVVIIAITIASGGADGGTTLQATLAALTGAAGTAAFVAAVKVLMAKLATYLIKMVVSMIIQEIIIQIVGDNELAMILGMLASIAVMSWEGGVEFDPEMMSFDDMGDIVGTAGTDSNFFTGFSMKGMTSFQNPATFTPMQWASVGIMAFSGVSTMKAAAIASAADALSAESTAWNRERAKKLTEISELTKIKYADYTIAAGLRGSARRKRGMPMSAEHFIKGATGYVDQSLASISSGYYDVYFDAQFETV